MIEQFAALWALNKDQLRVKLLANEPKTYEALVKTVVEWLNPSREGELPDAEDMVIITKGSYQGEHQFFIPCVSEWDSTVWYYRCGYGSCSGCDSLQAAEGIDDLMALALHVVQGLKVVVE